MSTSATESQGQEPGTNGTPSGDGAGQEPTAQQGQQGQGQEPPQQIDLDAITDPALRSYVETQVRQAAEARNEAARYRTERNQFQTQVSEFQRQNESDQERQQREAQEAQERLERLERENRELRVGTALQAAATKANAFNPELVSRMLDAKVALDDQGNPSNLDDLLTELRQSDPYLFKRTSADAGQGRGGENAPPAGGMNDLIRGAVAARRGRSTS